MAGGDFQRWRLVICDYIGVIGASRSNYFYMVMALVFDINYFKNLIMSFDLEFVQGNYCQTSKYMKRILPIGGYDYIYMFLTF
jgi:hypothetical protein